MPQENGLILRLLGIFHSECSKELDLSVLLNISFIGNILDLHPFSGRDLTDFGISGVQLPRRVLCPILGGIKRIFLTE